MNPREELLQIQKSITANLKTDIANYQGRQSRLFKKYLRDYEKEFKDYQSIIDKSELIERIMDCEIVYVGDYHTLNQSQKTLIKILRDITGRKQKITIALEMIYAEHQKHLDDFMKGLITEQQFLSVTNYYSNWGFPWKNYKPIFDFAKINNIRLLAANCSEKGASDILSQRDLCAAQVICKEAIKNPENMIFVLYGDLHVTEKHLPRKIATLLLEKGIKRKYAIIFQNSDELYWDLASAGKEQTADVVKISFRKFCILNTPPWIKLQTYLNWLEKSGDLLLTPKQKWYDEEDEPVDYFHQVSGLISTISSFLGLKNKNLDQFHLYTTEEIEFVDFMQRYMKNKTDMSLKETELIRTEVLYDGICLIPEENVIYLSNLSMNKVAEKAAQLIAFKLSGYYPKLGREEDRDFFYSRILFEVISYIGSKIINFKRKTDRLKDFKAFLEKTKGQRLKGRMRDQKEIARLVVDHKRFERRYLKKIQSSNPSFRKNIYRQEAKIFLGLTKALGFIVGNKLFKAIMTGEIEKSYLKRLFNFKAKKEGDSFRKYIELVITVQKIVEKYKSKTERF